MVNKPVLAGLLSEELASLLSSYQSFRSAQIYKWICGGAEGFDEMSNLPLALRKELAEHYTLISGTASSELTDNDGTVKLGITLEDGARIEAVILSDGEGRETNDKNSRKTACLSTQAGCPMGCVFCKTGAIGYRRNLTAAEIAGQFLHLRKKEPHISHIVVMGMGEPLLNIDELRKALRFFMDKSGLNISKRRITVSTCGIAKGIHDLAESGPGTRLALSLTTGLQELREKLMPVGRDNPLPLVKEALLRYQKKTLHRITLEMVLLGGINTGTDHAQAAAEFAEGLETVVNIIPWNPVEGSEFEGQPLKKPSGRETAEFTAALESRGLKVTRRTEKGRSISGACGQLGVV